MLKTHTTYVIAEAGVNHNGCFDTAIKLVDSAHAAGANAVKFQSFIPEALVTETVPKAGYQIKRTGGETTQLQMLEALALSFEQQQKLFDYCNEIGIEFLSTPFDLASQAFLCNTLNLPCIKVGSGDITNGPLLLAVAKANKRIILSTGMSNLNEIQEALEVIAYGYSQHPCATPSKTAFKNAYDDAAQRATLTQKVTLLHCTTEYPCPYEEVNLRALDTLAENFNLPVGYSDHTRGISVAVAAVARGAAIIEKHFTLDKNLPGPDHKASIEPAELKQMVTDIRITEACLGSAEKVSTQSESNNKAIARKHLVAARNVYKGERFTPDALTAKRTGHGLSPMHYWQLLNTPAKKNYLENEVITQ